MEELQTTPKEILVAGGSSALIEFVILVYRFAIKLCHGCNFWHSLFSLVLNLSCSVHLSHRSKGAQSSALHITWYHNRVLRIIYEFSPFLFRDGFYPSNAPVELWSRNQHTLSGSTNHNIIFGDFCRHRSKTWAAGATGRHEIASTAKYSLNFCNLNSLLVSIMRHF